MTSERAVVDWQWRDIGGVGWDGQRLVFPTVDAVPGIYRFTLWEPDGTFAVYIGETDRLPRRFQHYRTPGPTQLTNLRMNAEFGACMGRGGRIQVSIVTDGWVGDGVTTPVALDLTTKAGRVLLEHAAIAAATRQGWRLHNL